MSQANPGPRKITSPKSGQRQLFCVSSPNAVSAEGCSLEPCKPIALDGNTTLLPSAARPRDQDPDHSWLAEAYRPETSHSFFQGELREQDKSYCCCFTGAQTTPMSDQASVCPSAKLEFPRFPVSQCGLRTGSSTEILLAAVDTCLLRC